MSIIDAQAGSTVNCLHESKEYFSCYYENDFLVLPNGKTLVGSSGKNLVSEDLTTNNITTIGTMSSDILTVLYDPKTKSLFAGDGDGHLHQYQRSGDEDQFKLVKDYGDIGIGPIFSSCLCGDLAFFGGWGTSSLAAVKISEKKLVNGTFETAIGDIFSLEACRVSDSRVLVSVGGENPSYSESKSDILELKCEVEDTESETQPQPQPQPESSQAQNKKSKKYKKAKSQKSKTKKSQSQTQTDPITAPPPQIPANPNYSEKVLVDFMSKVLVYVQALFEDFVQKSQPRVVNKPYISK